MFKKIKFVFEFTKRSIIYIYACCKLGRLNKDYDLTIHEILIFNEILFVNIIENNESIEYAFNQALNNKEESTAK